VIVEEAMEVSAELVDAVRRLLPQLSASAAAPTHADIERIVQSGASHLLVARDGGSIVGMLTLVIFPIPTGVRAWIEDVVVDAQARGKGVGEVLNRAALEIAARADVRTVDLTSRANREAANRLYRRLGFEPRATNVYRYTLD